VCVDMLVLKTGWLQKSFAARDQELFCWGAYGTGSIEKRSLFSLRSGKSVKCQIKYQQQPSN
jgi:hypothetical protein